MAATKRASGNAAVKTKSRSKSSDGSKSSKSSPKSGVKKTSTANHNKKDTYKNKVEQVNEYKDRVAFETGVVLIISIIVSVFMYLSFLGMCGSAGNVVGGFCFGVFGWLSWILPAAVTTYYIFNISGSPHKRVVHKALSFSGILLALSGITGLLSKGKVITEYYEDNHEKYHGYLKCIDMTFRDVMAHGKTTGGIIGRWIETILKSVLGSVGAGVLLVLLLLLFTYLFIGMELMGKIRRRNAYMTQMEDTYEEINDEYDEPSYSMMPNVSKRRKSPVMHDGVGDGRQRAGYSVKRSYKKIQSVDLMKMNERLDKMEQQIALSSHSLAAPDEGRPMLSPDISKEAREKLKKELELKEIKESDKNGHISKNKSKKDAEKKKDAGNLVGGAIKPDEEDNRAVNVVKSFDGTGISDDETDDSVAILDIPIYREEMNRKFGRRQGMSVYESAAQNKIKRKDVSMEEKQSDIQLNDTMQNNLPKDSLLVQDTNDKASQNADVVLNDMHIADTLLKDVGTDRAKTEVKDEVYSAKSRVQIPETAKNAKEPLASFAPKIDEPNIVPLSEKQAAAAKQTSNLKSGEPVIKESDSNKNSQAVKEIEEKKKEEIIEKPYEFPDIELLKVPEAAKQNVSDGELRMTAAKLQSTLKSFNVNVQMGPVTCGPTVTRFELQPEQGVRVNKITNLADDLKLSLAAASIRIEAPIPGKSAVGIEVPNDKPSAVYFRELLEGEEFKRSKSPLTFAVGKDIAGKLIMTDIAKMPHLLIAGATGSGKSVCINTLIMSILYKADPKDVKLIMIDPKVVELSVYNGIPHLFCPVVTDPKEAAAALNWAVREMMDRYETFKEFGVRNITGYNEKIKNDDNYKKMPFLVIIVDEFADLMMVASKEVEDAVCRLAQLARAAGIHLVLATQRPSVNVITGVIKANIPSRIAFSVSSAIDSRTILDKGGAEKLIGKGDMLFFPSGYSEPVRVQGAFISDNEVSSVVDFLRGSNMEPEYNNSVTEIVEEDTPVKEKEIKKPEQDEYFNEAGYFVIESERAAAGQLQRRFSIGFNRAGRIIDQLHRAGVVGPAEGTKPRRILMTKDEFSVLVGDSVTASEQDGEVINDEMGITEETENNPNSNDRVVSI